MKRPFWETSYEKKGPIDTFDGGKPSSEFYELIKLLPPGSEVLDLGCGDGRHSIFLAENGYDVTAVDISEAGIEKLRTHAEAKGLVIKTAIQDMRDFEFNKDYDLIIAHGCLHLIERTEWQIMLDKIKDGTRPGGYNAVAVITDAVPPPDDLKEFTVGLFKEGELVKLYEDWKIIIQKAYIRDDEHPGSPPHQHAINKIVAQKLIADS